MHVGAREATEVEEGGEGEGGDVAEGDMRTRGMLYTCTCIYSLVLCNYNHSSLASLVAFTSHFLQF